MMSGYSKELGEVTVLLVEPQYEYPLTPLTLPTFGRRKVGYVTPPYMTVTKEATLHSGQDIPPVL